MGEVKRLPKKHLRLKPAKPVHYDANDWHVRLVNKFIDDPAELKCSRCVYWLLVGLAMVISVIWAVCTAIEAVYKVLRYTVQSLLYHPWIAGGWLFGLQPRTWAGFHKRLPNECLYKGEKDFRGYCASHEYRKPAPIFYLTPLAAAFVIPMQFSGPGFGWLPNLQWYWFAAGYGLLLATIAVLNGIRFGFKYYVWSDIKTLYRAYCPKVIFDGVEAESESKKKRAA
jgi:hypothetical protein